ncbi:MAG: TetR/AcrR family transcriptional regulator [Phycisphaerales bacterium JB040]
MPAAERREQLLDVASELFSRQGYARATTSQLARAAGVTEPIIYRHFKSKKDLFVALIERTGRRTLDQWGRDLEGAPDPAERLARLIGDNPMVSEQGRESYRVFLQSISEIDDEGIREAVRDHVQSLHGFVTREIEAAQSEKKVTDRFPAGVIAWMLLEIGMGYGVMSAMKVEGHGAGEGGLHVKDVLTRVLIGKG